MGPQPEATINAWTYIANHYSKEPQWKKVKNSKELYRTVILENSHLAENVNNVTELELESSWNTNSQNKNKCYQSFQVIDSVFFSHLFTFTCYIKIWSSDFLRKLLLPK